MAGDLDLAERDRKSPLGKFSTEARNSSMSDKNVSRRRAIKIVASGALVATIALPSKWSRPIVESIIVPAHAQASPPLTTGTGTTATSTTGTTTATTTVTTVTTGTTVVG